MVLILVPPIKFGGIVVNVGFSFNGGFDWIFNKKLNFTYYSNEKLIKLTPTHGRGGTKVKIEGLFQNSHQDAGFVLCKFGSVIFVAHKIALNENYIICSSPSRKEMNSTEVPVSISLNGYNFSPEEKFVYDPEVDILGLEPNYTTVSGNTYISVLGGPFPNRPGLLCRFMNETANATWISSKELKCLSPKIEREDENIEVNSIEVHVSLNYGVDFSFSGATLTYYPNVEVINLNPRHGIIEGGTEIIVSGKNFYDTPGLACIFQESLNSYKVVPVSNYVNKTNIICKSPIFESAQSVEFKVTLNEVQISNELVLGIDTDVYFTYDEPIKLSKIFPEKFPSSGNVSVVIYGGPFTYSNLLRCRFGNLIVNAEFITENQILCIAPSHAPGLIPIGISQNGQQYTNSKSVYEYYQDIVLNHIFPTTGVAGSIINIYGSGFVNSSNLFCRFGAREVLAIFVSHDHLVCENPSIIERDLRWLSLDKICTRHTFSDTRDMLCVNYTYSDSISYPLYLGSQIGLEVSNNAQDYTQSGLQLHYQEDIMISSIENLVGPVFGGSPIFIRGKNFVNSTSLSCLV